MWYNSYCLDEQNYQGALFSKAASHNLDIVSKALSKYGLMSLAVRLGNGSVLGGRFAMLGKICGTCKQYKQISEFGVLKRSKDGYRNTCRACRYEIETRYSQKNKEKISEYRKEYYKENHERFIQYGRDTYDPEQNRIYKAANSERIAKQKKIYNERTKEQQQEYRRKRYLVIKDQAKEYHAKWSKENKERASLHASIHAHLKRANGGTFTTKQWEKLVAYYCADGKCLRCGEISKQTIDHVIPLSKGGTNYIDNIQPLCKSCNSHKNNRIITDYRPDNGEYARILKEIK